MPPVPCVSRWYSFCRGDHNGIASQQQHVKHELIIYLVYNGDVKADSSGARLPAWLDHQSAFIFTPHGRQTKLNFKSKANLNTDGAFFL